MSRDDLSTILRRLPAETARPGFTARVLASLDEAPRRAARLRLSWVGAGVGLLAVVAAGFGTWYERQQETLRARTELAAVRQEHARLTAELSRLRQLREGSAPLVYLGSAEGYAVFLDPAGEPESAEGDGAVRPAAWRER